MQPVWAKRLTRCNKCGESIQPGQRRVDTYYRRNKKFFRVHYHFEDPECYKLTLEGWFERNPIETSKGHGGRPRMELAPEQMVLRKKLLSQLSAHYNYYVPRLLKINASTPTALDLKRIAQFELYRHTLVGQLEALGGAPEKYLRQISMSQEVEVSTL